MEKVKVSKEFILKAHKDACSDWKKKIETELPKLFKNTFKVGDWVQFQRTEGCRRDLVLRICSNDRRNPLAYGIDSDEPGDWHELTDRAWSFNWEPQNWKKLTKEEVGNFLTEVALCKGYKNGIVVASAMDRSPHIIRDSYITFEFENLYLDGTCILNETGEWAKIHGNLREMKVGEIEDIFDSSVRLNLSTNLRV